MHCWKPQGIHLREPDDLVLANDLPKGLHRSCSKVKRTFEWLLNKDQIQGTARKTQPTDKAKDMTVKSFVKSRWCFRVLSVIQESL